MAVAACLWLLTLLIYVYTLQICCRILHNYTGLELISRRLAQTCRLPFYYRHRPHMLATTPLLASYHDRGTTGTSAPGPSHSRHLPPLHSQVYTASSARVFLAVWGWENGYRLTSKGPWSRKITINRAACCGWRNNLYTLEALYMLTAWHYLSL